MSDLAAKECVPCKGGVPPLKGEELTKLRQQLEEDWQFGVVAFECDQLIFKPDVVTASEGVVDEATDWLDGLVPGGGAGTGPAMVEAFGLANQGREGAAWVVLYSHTDPDCGASSRTAHRNMALNANVNGHVVHAFGFSPSPGAADFLESLTLATGGFYYPVE